MTKSVEEIARGLTDAQRRYLTDKAVWMAPSFLLPKRWMAFPPPATHRVLMRHNLMDRSGQILTDGLAVRAHLLGETHDR